MGNGGQVQHGVGAAAEGHIYGFCVVEGCGGHDIPGADILLYQLHNLHTGMLGKPQAGGVGGGDGAVAGQCHTDGLGQAVHGVGGIHAGAGPAGGTGVFLIVTHTVLVQRAGVVGTHCLEHVAEAGASAVLQVAGQHGSAGDENGGDIQAGSGHQQAGHVFVAVGDHDKPVKLVGNGHGLGGVGNQVTGDKGVFHADVPHGNAVTHGDGREDHRGPAGCRDACLDRIGDLVQIHVARDDLIPGAHHADNRAADLLVGETESIKQAAVRGAFNAFFDEIGLHGKVPFFCDDRMEKSRGLAPNLTESGSEGEQTRSAGRQ